MATQSTRRPTAAKTANRSKAAAALVEAVEPPKSPAQAEAEGVETVVVEWRGYTFTVVADPDEWNFWTVTTPAARGNIPQLLYGLLGAEVMGRLREAYPTMTAADGRDLYDTIERTIGFASGKA